MAARKDLETAYSQYLELKQIWFMNVGEIELPLPDMVDAQKVRAAGKKQKHVVLNTTKYTGIRCLDQRSNLGQHQLKI